MESGFSAAAGKICLTNEALFPSVGCRSSANSSIPLSLARVRVRHGVRGSHSIRSWRLLAFDPGGAQATASGTSKGKGTGTDLKILKISSSQDILASRLCAGASSGRQGNLLNCPLIQLTVVPRGCARVMGSALVPRPCRNQRRTRFDNC